MRRVLAVLMVLWAVPAWADTHAASSCNNTAAQPHVQNAINAASSGDTVTVPSGSCTWTSGVTVTKPLSVIGSGEGVTIITDGVTDTQTPLISYTTAEGGLYRFSAMTVHGGSTAKNPEIGTIRFTGSGNQIPVDHCTLISGTVNYQSTTLLSFNHYVRGVVDHCDITQSTWNVPVYVFHGTWGNVGATVTTLGRLQPI